jgi:hypothetical protein
MIPVLARQAAPTNALIIYRVSSPTCLRLFSSCIAHCTAAVLVADHLSSNPMQSDVNRTTGSAGPDLQ